MAPEITINREQWQRIEEEFGQGGKIEPLGGTRVQLDDTGFRAEFGDGEGDVAAWATQKSTRIDTRDLSLYVSQERVLLLKRLGPYPIARWRVLYDSRPHEPTNMTQTDQLLNARAQAAAVRQPQDAPDSERLLREFTTALRVMLGTYYQGQVDEADPAVPLVKVLMLRAGACQTGVTSRAVEIVRAVRSTVPVK